MPLCRFSSFGICIAMTSTHSAEQQRSNFRILFLSECVFFWDFSLRSLPTLQFSEFAFFWQLTFFSAKSTVFRRLTDFRCPKEYALNRLILLALQDAFAPPPCPATPQPCSQFSSVGIASQNHCLSNQPLFQDQNAVKQTPIHSME